VLDIDPPTLWVMIVCGSNGWRMSRSGMESLYPLAKWRQRDKSSARRERRLAHHIAERGHKPQDADLAVCALRY